MQVSNNGEITSETEGKYFFKHEINLPNSINTSENIDDMNDFY